MGLYSYKLHNINEEHKGAYKEKDLRLMTTFQLREICDREKLVKSIVNPLDKEELIRLIMKYRGEKDYLLINFFNEGGLERIEKFIKKSEKHIAKNKTIDYPGKLTIYEEIDLDIYDDYVLKSTEELCEGNVLLVDDSYRVCTVFNIKKIKIENGFTYYLTKGKSVAAFESESRHYSLLLFSEKDSELLFKIYTGESTLSEKVMTIKSLPILQFEIKQLNETVTPLAIDFGTSNTTAGIYIDKEIFNSETVEERIKLIKIMDTTQDVLKITPLIPSIVAIEQIKDGNIKYSFGYDAMKISQKRYLDDGLTIFYDIKRWVSDFEKEEKVIDSNETSTFIKRKDIIKAYLLHIISLADQRFKCKFKKIYISCPSKQRFKFHTLFKEILSDYVVESENILEESVAVLYNTVSELIEKNKYIQGEWYKALIIDCGGGTTDLSGCSFNIKNNRISYELNIETSYENGDTDFGGNNLTFRIMQFIKILMADALSKRDMTIKKAIVDEFNKDIFRSIDKYGISELYSSLNNEYEKAEEIIPTKFQVYETRSKEDYCKVRSNYYFLFDLAERVKKKFFSNPDLLNITLTSSISKEAQDNTILFDKWKLSYMNNGNLKIVKEAPSILLNIYEVTTLIKGDVYNIIRKFLNKLYENDELYDYSLIKLTGQSCKVEIFRDALKEFIPGKIIEVNRNKRASEEEYELKLACIKGALRYLYDKNFGYADINIQSKTPTLPYIVTAFTHTGEEKVLIKGKEIKKGTISRFADKIILKLYLKSLDNAIKYEYAYNFRREELEKTDAKTIGNLYPNINQHETDNIENNEVKFFAWVEEDLWGFYVLAVLRQDEELYVGKEKFFYFENDEWEKNFFDGLK
ncbi:molecular chaperone [Clostridium butyricum]|uniref:molecular chaperone n=1 Tax=Clostridium TaxID=1485 RepID=UPI0029041981|nr:MULTISPECIES: molecular chaperone [Clostridium]MDU1604295.1 molecular chaperone [Clostridium sp.]